MKPIAVSKMLSDIEVRASIEAERLAAKYSYQPYSREAGS